jgi:hypothetical protein
VDEPVPPPGPAPEAAPCLEHPEHPEHQALRAAIVRPGHLRASDEERDQAIGELREHFAAGRLSHDTFMGRMNTALDARHQADLPPLFADLPGRRPRGWLSAGWAGSMVHRLLGALPGAQSGRAHSESSARPAPARGLTDALQRASGDRDPRHHGQGSPLPPPIRLPFPRGTATAFTIGRDRRSDLAIDDLTVSRQHARLHRTEAGDWLLSDLGSRNGTRVNGWRVRDAVEVRAGDLVRFGDVVYILGGED